MVTICTISLRSDRTVSWHWHIALSHRPCQQQVTSRLACRWAATDSYSNFPQKGEITILLRSPTVCPTPFCPLLASPCMIHLWPKSPLIQSSIMAFPYKIPFFDLPYSSCTTMKMKAGSSSETSVPIDLHCIISQGTWISIIGTSVSKHASNNNPSEK